jgi:hypothetical protein
LAWAIVRALEDTEASTRWAEQALQKVQERLTWPVIACETLAVFEQLVASHRNQWPLSQQ